MLLDPRMWFQTKAATTLTNPHLFDLLGGGSATNSNIAVTPASAMSVPAVNAAVRVISESVALLPVNVMQDDGTSKAVAKDHPVNRILQQPNAWTSSYSLRLQMQADTLLFGNAYAFVNRIGGVVREIIRLQPSGVSVEIDLNSGEPSYVITDLNGGQRRCSHTEIIHIKAFSHDGTIGVAVIHQAKEAIALALALEMHAGRLMANAGRPSGVLKVKGKLLQGGFEKIRSQWQASQTGSAAGSTAIFDQDVDFAPITFNSVDMEFSAMRSFQLDEVSRGFRVPPAFAVESRPSDLGQRQRARSELLGLHANAMAYAVARRTRSCTSLARRTRYAHYPIRHQRTDASEPCDP